MVQEDGPGGAMVTPGNYSASLYLEQEGEVKLLDGPVQFEVKPIRDGVLQGVDYDTYNAYRERVSMLQGEYTAMNHKFLTSKNLLRAYKDAASKSNLEPGTLSAQFQEADALVRKIDLKMNGSPTKNKVGEKNDPNYNTYMRMARAGLRTTYGPTPLHKQNLEHAEAEFKTLQGDVEDLATQKLPAIEAVLNASDAPAVLKN